MEKKQKTRQRRGIFALVSERPDGSVRGLGGETPDETEEDPAQEE